MRHNKKQNISNDFDYNFNLLNMYLNEHNYYYPAVNEIYCEVALGRWIKILRDIYNNGLKEDEYIVYKGNIITNDQIDRLNSINFIWDEWDYNFKLLYEYLFNNNGKYPHENEYYKNIALGRWINILRLTYNNGKLQEDGSYKYKIFILTKKQLDKLNSINFIFNDILKFNNNEKWNKNFEMFKEYLIKKGGIYPKQSEDIWYWVSTQRKIYTNGKMQEDGSYKYKGSILTKEQIDILNQNNFKWYAYNESDYYMNFKSDTMSKKIRKILLFRLKETLEKSKNEINSKEDINKISDEFAKSLIRFD